MRPPAACAVVRTGVLRLVTLLLLGLAVATGAALAAGTSPAWADPAPTPAPTPGVGVPDPGVPPVPDKTPAPPKPTPSPIPAPPTGTPSPTPPGTPSPAPGPTPPGWTPPAPDNNNDPGLFDIPGQIRKAINDFIAWIAKTGLKPVLDALGHTVLSTPNLTANPQVKAIWTTSLVTANAIFVLFVIAGGFIITSRETLQSNYGLKQIAPRVVVAGVAANVSLLVCGKAIEAANALTAAIAGQGVDGNGAATALNQILNQPPSPNMPPILFSLLILAALVMAIVVLITFILRTALLVLLIGVAPLALTCHATPQTEGLAYTWWRAFGACLAIQLGQAVIVLATVRVFLTPAGPEALGVPLTNDGLIAILVCLTMLWLLIKLPGWTKHLILGPLARQHGRGLVGQIIHAVIMLKTLGTLAGISRGTSRPARSGQRPGTGPSPTGPSPSPSGPRPGTGGPRPSRPPRPPRPGRPRPVPAPAGPASFSNAPGTHTPLATPAGTPTAPAFSGAPQPATPRPSQAGGVPPARFSHQPAAQPTPTPAARPAPAQFSHRPTPAVPRRPPTGSVPAASFSAATRPQTAPKRPPAPVTPVFSTPARPAPGGGTRPARAGSPPARPVPAVPARPRRVDPPSPPSPRGSASARRAPAPPPSPSPPSPPARAPRPAPSPPVPPSPPRRTRPERKG